MNIKPIGEVMDAQTTVRKRLHIFHKREAVADGQRWYWHMTLGNGEVVAQGEMYANKADMLHTLRNVFDLEDDAVEGLNLHHMIAWLVTK